jgi:hypothetical protein
MIKQEVMNLINKLPESATIEDIMYELYILEKHKNAVTAIENGEVLTLDEVKGMLTKQ